MSEVYITGHRNPDMDSLCAAYAYAALKNLTDRVNHYVPIRCGHISESVERQFSVLGIEAPVYIRDITPKVSDVMRTDEIRIQREMPVYDLMDIMRRYNDGRPSVMPLFDGDAFIGLLSIDDIASWFLNDNIGSYPRYELSLGNMIKVLGCRVLKKGERERFKAPLLSGAAHVDEHPDAVIVMPYGKKYAELAMKADVPAIILTDVNGEIKDLDYSAFKGSILITDVETTEAIRRLRMSCPVFELLGKQGPVLQTTDLFDDAKEQLTSSKLRGLAVFDGDSYVGFVTRRCFLRKPRQSVILVDHNEPNQSIKGIETADVREIIDHHRLDAPKTDLPIFIDSEPLGSTCTIIYQLFVRNSIVPDLMTSKVLLAGILADTITLKSPTTTGMDILSAEKLAPLAGIVDLREFGKDMFDKVGSLDERDPETVITSDFKTYNEGGIEVGIGQCEVQTLSDVDEYSAKYLVSLEKVRRASKLDWVLLMITDVLKGRSILLSSGHRLEKKLPYEVMKPQIFDMKDAVSRKKQLLPEVVHAIGG